ncbi:hypothetical protein [Ulvibacterium sp.]|uniref:hypothetical protein n=1 Tax=Ulvibacterium sp. TaxID=2665914 RepID=UPI003BAC9E3D
MTGTIATFNAGYRMSSFNYSIREFEYSDTQISTLSDNLVYVGETTEYVFIFHKDLVKTSAFPKAEINNLKFYNFEAVKDLEYWKYIKEEREKRNKEEID